MKKIYVLFLTAMFTLNLQAQNNCIQFDGNDDDIYLSSSPALMFDVNDKFSVEAWFKTNSSTFIVLTNHEDISPFVGWEVALVFGKVMMELDNHYINSAIRVETNATFNDGNWHHAAWVYHGTPNASACQIYVDGILQTLNVNINNLTGSFATNNEVHMGSRNATAYWAPGELDEVRIWKRTLCAAEIQAHKSCYLVGNEPGLEAYYRFNQGVASGNNAGVPTVTDLTANAHTATLSMFALTGSTSNWIASTNSISGNCTSLGGMAVGGPTVMCKGTSGVTLTASGATSYTWFPGNVVGNNVAVNPTVTTTYTVYSINSNSCLTSANFVLTVTDCIGIEETNSANDHVHVYPNPNNGSFYISLTETTEIILVNALGQTLKKYNTKETIEIKDLEEGIYFAIGKTENKQWRKKIVVSK
jgi:hypothetical protein